MSQSLPAHINGCRYVGVETISVGTPAAGTALVYSPAAGQVLKLISLAALYTCSAVAGNRNVRLQFLVPPGAPASTVQHWVLDPTALTLSQSARIFLSEGLQQSPMFTHTASGGLIAEGFYLYAALPLLFLDGRSGGITPDRLIISPAGILAADQISEISLQAHVWERVIA
jgi:hypothetical protein